MLSVLNEVRKTFGAPSPYYAILLMDGDNMGKALSAGDPEKISSALLKFNKATEERVYDNNGFLIYAGGDDVLALLPVEDALSCAYQLHVDYDRFMQEIECMSTLSGAIQFAHIKTPLTLLLQNAHDLLDNVAKKQCKRDSLAIRVWNHGGLGLEWGMPWRDTVEDKKFILQELLETIQDHDRNSKGQFSHRFFYQIHEVMNNSNGLDFNVQEKLLFNAYLNSRKNNNNLISEKDQYSVKKLFNQCKNCPTSPLLLRFLVRKSLEKSA